MSTPTTLTIADRAAAALEAGDYAGLAELYADDVVLDLHMPGHRVQLTGRTAAQQFVRDEVAGLSGLHATWSRRVDTADGIAVEVECHHSGDQLFRAVELLTIADGRVIAHTEYCTGNSPATAEPATGHDPSA